MASSTENSHTFIRPLLIQLGHLRQYLARRTGLHSIQGRLIAIAFMFIIGTSVTMGITSYHFTASFERQRFHEHFNLLAGYMANNAELGVMIGDTEMLERISAGMLLVKDVQSVAIFDAGGAELISKGEHSSAEYGTAVAPIKSQVMDEAALFSHTSAAEQPLGEVKLSYSLSGLYELQRLLAHKYALISLVLSLAPVAMYWMLARAINAPLKQLVKLARQVGRGNMDVRAKGGTLLETRTLAHAINEMLETLEERRREIQHTNAAMARQQVLAEVGKFSMIVAHEIKNPLAVIKGSMDILARPERTSPEIQARMVGYINDEVQRMNKLIEDFLMFSRPRDPDFRPIEADELVTRMLHKIALIDRTIGIDKQLQPEAVTRILECDIIQFERALLNVVRNAIEASKAAAKVTVAVRSDTSFLSFSISDGGAGINTANAQRMFDPFFSTKAKGTGLGLALVKEVIAAHKGLIKVHNIPTGGACFTLQLPLSAAQHKRDTAQTVSVQPETQKDTKHTRLEV